MRLRGQLNIRCQNLDNFQSPLTPPSETFCVHYSQTIKDGTNIIGEVMRYKSLNTTELYNSQSNEWSARDIKGFVYERKYWNDLLSLVGGCELWSWNWLERK